MAGELFPIQLASSSWAVPAPRAQWRTLSVVDHFGLNLGPRLLLGPDFGLGLDLGFDLDLGFGFDLDLGFGFGFGFDLTWNSPQPVPLCYLHWPHG